MPRARTAGSTLPPALGGTGKGTDPEQLFAAGCAACFAGAMAAVSCEMKLDTEDVSVTAEVSVGKDGVRLPSSRTACDVEGSENRRCGPPVTLRLTCERCAVGGGQR